VESQPASLSEATQWSKKKSHLPFLRPNPIPILQPIAKTTQRENPNPNPNPLPDEWIGRSATMVQIGDMLNHGGDELNRDSDELKILYFLKRLKWQAARIGGTVITMNSNHEIMNVEGDFQYVTRERERK
jgi:hypothetical protein